VRQRDGSRRRETEQHLAVGGQRRVGERRDLKCDAVGHDVDPARGAEERDAGDAASEAILVGVGGGMTLALTQMRNVVREEVQATVDEELTKSEQDLLWCMSHPDEAVCKLARPTKGMLSHR